MSQSVQTQAELLALFADGQAQGAITPQFVRDLIVSVGQLAATNQQAPVWALGTGAAQTVNFNNGSVQTATANLGSLAITVTALSLGTGLRLRMELYITNNSSGNATLTWGSNVTYVGTSPQLIAQANAITKFILESLDGGATWSITV